jgi:hypothetical protein
VTLFLVGVAVLACWLGSLYFWPFGPCGGCKGSGRNAGSNSRRFGNCKRCGGNGRRQRFGSRAVHRAVRGAVAANRRRQQ